MAHSDFGIILQYVEEEIILQAHSVIAPERLALTLLHLATGETF